VAEAQDRLLQLASPRLEGVSLARGLAPRRSALDKAETAAQVRAALAQHKHQHQYQQQQQHQHQHQHPYPQQHGDRLLMLPLVSGVIRAKRDATALGRLFARWRRATAATVSAARVLLVYLRMRRAKLLAQCFGRLSRNAAFRTAVVIATRRGATLNPAPRPPRNLQPPPPPPPPTHSSSGQLELGAARSSLSLPLPVGWHSSAVLSSASSPSQLHRQSRASRPSSGRAMPWER
jgi:hypothetical protein